MRPGLVLKPETEINDEIINSIKDNLIEIVLIMTVSNKLNYFFHVFRTWIWRTKIHALNDEKSLYSS